MRYTLIITRAAQKQLRHLQIDLRARIVRKLASLEQNSRPHGVEKLAGFPDLYRVRVGNCRIVYQIRDRELIILLLRVAAAAKHIGRRGKNETRQGA